MLLFFAIHASLLQPQLQTLMAQAMATAAGSRHAIRIANAIQTIDCFVHGSLTCPRTANARPPNIQELFFRNDAAARAQLSVLIDACRLRLTEEQPIRLKSIVLNFLLSMTSVSTWR